MKKVFVIVVLGVCAFFAIDQAMESAYQKENPTADTSTSPNEASAQIQSKTEEPDSGRQAQPDFSEIQQQPERPDSEKLMEQALDALTHHNCPLGISKLREVALMRSQNAVRASLAQQVIGVLHMTGECGDRNYYLAYIWAGLAARTDIHSHTAEKLQFRVFDELTIEERSQAHQLISVYFENNTVPER